MRVLHVLHTSLPYVCGYSIRSERILSVQRAMGMEVAALTSAQQPDNRQDEILDGIEHFRTRCPSLARSPAREAQLMWVLGRRLDAVLARFRPEVVHAHSPVLVGLPAYLRARRHRLPFVYEVRDLWENASVDRGKFADGSPWYRASRALETWLLRRADAVVTICEALRAELASRRGEAPDVSVAPNGVDLEAFVPRPPDPALRRRLGLDEGPLLAYLGAFQPYEGLELLVHAMQHVAAVKPEARLAIVGDGPERSRLEREAADRGVAGVVRFVGRVPHRDVADWYSAADLLVYPRLLTRTTALTTPLKPLEAMAMERCVLASDVPAMREIVNDGSTGLLFSAGDAVALARAIVALIDDGPRRAALARSGRRWVQRERDWNVIVPTYGPVYNWPGVERPARVKACVESLDS